MTDTPTAPTPGETPIYTQMLAEYAAANDRPGSEPAPTEDPDQIDIFETIAAVEADSEPEP